VGSVEPSETPLCAGPHGAPRQTEPCEPAALLLSVALLAPLLATGDALFAFVGGALHDRELAVLGAGTGWGARSYLVGLWAITVALVLLVLLELAIAATARALARIDRLGRDALATAVALWSSPLAFYLGWYLLSGGAMRRWLVSPVWRIAVGAGLAAALFALARLWLRRVEPLDSWVRGVLALVALGMLALDQIVLPGLYPPCHALLVLGATLILQRLFWESLVAHRPRTRLRGALLAGGIVAVLVAVPLALPWDSRPFENFVVGRFSIFSGKALSLVGDARRALCSRGTGAAIQLSGGPRDEALGRLLGATRGRWPDLYLIFVDGLSPFRTSLAGHRRDTTPFLASLASRGLYFPRAYSTAPGTIASLRSVLSGEYQHEQRPPRAPFVPRLVERFTTLGYLSYCDVPFASETLRGARCSLQVSIERADWSRDGLLSYLASARAPVLAFVLLSATHFPYQPLGPDFGASREDRYDSALAGTDRLLRELHAAIQRLGRDARYVITGDHGHAFGWHGLHGHNSSLYEDQIRVPLVLSGFPYPPRRIEAAVSLLDLTTALAGGAGADLARVLDGEGRRADVPLAAFHREQRAMIASELKLIVDGSLGSAELYDLSGSPRETQNVAAARPELVSRLRAKLEGLQPFQR
jgi:hypothetical protein